MPIELTEKEFLELLGYRLKKLEKLGEEKGYQAHVNLLNYYDKCKQEGYEMRFFILEDSSLVIHPYTKEELKLFEKKYRERGIW